MSAIFCLVFQHVLTHAQPSNKQIRELAPVELVLRFAEQMIFCYKSNDDDCVNILDHNEIHIIPVGNPDGRKFVEWQLNGKFPKSKWDEHGEQTYGDLWKSLKDKIDIEVLDAEIRRQNAPLLVFGNDLLRKNRNEAGCIKNTDNIGQLCGVDINRNFDFAWNAKITNWVAKGSNNANDSVYQGTKAESEPETTIIANYMRKLFPHGEGANWIKPDQYEGKDITNKKNGLLEVKFPEWNSGLFIDLHSYGKILAWPWSYRNNATPNDLALQALARKLTSFNHYDLAGPQHPDYMYSAKGTTTDYVYGKLGVASFTLEIGVDFWETCDAFDVDNSNNMAMLKYSALNAKFPYSTAQGPDIVAMTLSKKSLSPLDTLSVSITASDSTLIDDCQIPSVQQAIDSIWLYLDAHPYHKADQFIEKQVYTSSMKNTNTATFQLSMKDVLRQYGAGKHTLYAIALDDAGYFGVVQAASFNLTYCQ
jgi:carboxypeptidase T